MDFKNAGELLEICKREDLPISEVMRMRECERERMSVEAVNDRMRRVLEVMKRAARDPVKRPPSENSLIGGESEKLTSRREKQGSLLGPVLSRAVAYSQAVMEKNSAMELVVAAPTAGSAGVVPGVYTALQDVYELSDETLLDALFTAGAVGYLAMRNATVAGAVGGCQAEVGVAAAMSAAAVVEMFGGSPEDALGASTIVFVNMLGLVCDPVCGLVEFPCQTRNATGAANALLAAEMALSGIRPFIPFDEMLETMKQVGARIPPELRETALGGCAATPSAHAYCRMRGIGVNP